MSTWREPQVESSKAHKFEEIQHWDSEMTFNLKNEHEEPYRNNSSSQWQEEGITRKGNSNLRPQKNTIQTLDSNPKSSGWEQATNELKQGSHEYES